MCCLRAGKLTSRRRSQVSASSRWPASGPGLPSSRFKSFISVWGGSGRIWTFMAPSPNEHGEDIIGVVPWETGAEPRLEFIVRLPTGGESGSDGFPAHLIAVGCADPRHLHVGQL